jgi:putative phage-type endonuclease
MNIEVLVWRLCRCLGADIFASLPNNKLVAILREFTHLTGANESDVERRIADIKRDRIKLEALRALPAVAQRSQEWFDLRKERLTASDASKALVDNRSREILVRNKAFPEQSKFINSVATEWGKTFESMALRMYRARHENITVHEFGLIPHPTLSCFGASPDGISDIGVMIEIKCPWSREIKPNYIPDYYETQMQGQLAVCGLTQCDYIECKIIPNRSIEKYLEQAKKCKTTADYGVYVDGKFSEPGLTPEETIEWAQRTADLNSREIVTPYATEAHEITNGVILWSLDVIQIQRVTFDPKRWDIMVPKFEKFWQDVLTERSRKKETVEFIDDDD